jgi:hypothetical protein
MLSDLDEMPNSKFLGNLFKLTHTDVLIAEMDLFVYCPHLKSRIKWRGTIATRYDGTLPDMQRLRMRAVRWWLEDRAKIIEDGGSHFSSFLDARGLRDKIRSFSHTELDTFPFNYVVFLRLIRKLGIPFDGSETLELVTGFDGLNSSSEFCSYHKFDQVRMRVSRLIQPSIRRLFEMRVKSLSAPESKEA